MAARSQLDALQWARLVVLRLALRGGRLCSNRMGPLWRLDVDDPKSGKKLLGLREYAICDGKTVFASPHQFGLVGNKQAFSEATATLYRASRRCPCSWRTEWRRSPNRARTGNDFEEALRLPLRLGSNLRSVK